jgi:glycosyltransferase involved in cell wall biosynthesis
MRPEEQAEGHPEEDLDDEHVVIVGAARPLKRGERAGAIGYRAPSGCRAVPLPPKPETSIGTSGNGSPVVAFNALSIRPRSWGGGVTFALNVLHHLQRTLDDAEIVVFCRRGETRLPEGPNIVPWEMSIAGGTHRIAVETLRLSRALRRCGADVLVSPNESIPFKAPCPVVVVAQNLVYHYENGDAFSGHGIRDRVATRAQRAYYRRRMSNAYRRAARVVPVSEETRRVLAAHSSLDPRSATVVMEGADSLFLPAPSSGLRREHRLLIVSTIAPHKNLELAIELFAEIRRRRPELTLQIAGADSRGFEHVLRRKIAALDVTDAVELVGLLDPVDLAELYERSLLLLQLSTCEAFGLPAVEAMRFGLPVVAARHSSLPEVAAGAAALIDLDDLPGSIDAVDALLGDEDARSVLAERGRARAAELTWEATAGALAAVAVEATGGGFTSRCPS